MARSVPWTYPSSERFLRSQKLRDKYVAPGVHPGAFFFDLFFEPYSMVAL